MIWLIICTGALALFLAVSILILKLFRQYAIKSYTHKTNLNELMDKEAIVWGENTNGILVKVSGIEWSAINQSKKGVVAGDPVIIKGVQGVKLLIEKVERKD